MKTFIITYLIGSLINIFLFIIKSYNTNKFKKFNDELNNLTRFGYISKKDLNFIIMLVLILGSWLFTIACIHNKLTKKLDEK